MAQHGYLRDYDEGRDDGEDRDRKWMFGDSDRGEEHRGAVDRMDDNNGDGARRMFDDDDRQGRGEDRAPRKFSGHQDDHYRNWRDRQMQALDRDYEDYCREREQQFHSDFDAWRSQRRGNNPGPLRTGMTQTGQSHDPSGMTELANEARDNAEPKADPIDAATLGTNSRAD